MTELEIGTWIQRQRWDRIEQRGRWHLVESIVDGAAITKCGRRMERRIYEHHVSALTTVRANSLLIHTKVPYGEIACMRCQ